MEVVNVNIGFVVMWLRFLIDEVCCRLLVKNGIKLMEFIENFFYFFGLREKIIKGNIEVVVYVFGEEIGDSK